MTASETRRPVLEAFDRVLGREIHHLRQRPELLWQQLYNELQWEGDDVEETIAAELARRTAPFTTPWLCRRTRLRQSGLLAVLAGHEGWVSACAIAPDGSYVASASQDGTVRIWDPGSGEELQRLAGHEDWVGACAVPPDGGYVVSAGEDQTVRVWDPRSGEELQRLAGHEGSVTACAVAPDGGYVVSASEDKTVRVWDPRGGEELQRLAGHEDWVTACAIAPNGRYVVSTSRDGTVRVWEAMNGRLVGLISLLGELLCVALHSCEPVAACGDGVGTLNIVELAGIDYGPLIVTACRREGALEARCPRCRRLLPVAQEALGHELTCRAGCGTHLRLNPFTLNPAGTQTRTQFVRPIRHFMRWIDRGEARSP